MASKVARKRVVAGTRFFALALTGLASSVVLAATSTGSTSGQSGLGSATIGQTLSQTGIQSLGAFSGVASDAAASANGGGFTSGSNGIRRFALPGQGATGAAGAPGGKAWNAWVAYSQNKVGYSFQPLAVSGTVGLTMAGVDYTFANNIVLGLAVAGDKSDIGLSFSGGTLRGTGYTVAPYIGIPINKAWTFDATLGYGRTKLEINSLGANGNFDSKRTIGSLGLTYRHAIGNWQLTGRGALLSVEDRLGAYTLSNGTFNSSGTVNVAQMRVGGQAGYNFGGVVPYVGLTYIYDFRRPDQQPIAGQSAANDRDAWTPVVGIRFSSGNSLYGGIQYSSEQSRSQVKNDQWMLNLGVRF